MFVAKKTLDIKNAGLLFLKPYSTITDEKISVIKIIRSVRKNNFRLKNKTGTEKAERREKKKMI